ncbi:hypothetical protein FKP32DRAFT_1754486 [Trametes sanguinea]|nr:hypothetical protein FKP32DRAFT_1754486 [Trametes sanguinea]
MSSANRTHTNPSLSKSDPGTASHAHGGEDQSMDNTPNTLGDAEKSFEAYASSKTSKAMNRSGDLLDTVQSEAPTAMSIVSSLQSVYQSDGMRPVRDGLTAFVDTMPELLKGLDTVAHLHPFVGIVVDAFKIVIELDRKRRDNDKKIETLFLQMQGMMSALLDLGTIKDRDLVGPDGKTIEARMQELVKRTAGDIKACGNACDTYAKKRFIVKVIKSSVWDSTLKSYFDLFVKRQKEFTFALAIHTGIAVDDANRKLNELDAKIDTVLKHFEASTSDRDMLAALVQEKGGSAVVMANVETLRELLKFSPVTGPRSRGDRQVMMQQSVEEDLKIVRQELFENPDAAIRSNMEVFERKYAMQQMEFAEEMRRMVRHEGDRVINAFISGPHDRIYDPDIHAIWKEMRWPGHVKTRHFVLALVDYFREQLELKKHSRGDNSSLRIKDEDEWASEWVSVNRLQAIAEAFDEDASGFVTVVEVNRFTTSRPKNWSLVHWLAFWAIGWQMTTASYKEEILRLMGTMFSLERHILQANLRGVQMYLSSVWQVISLLVTALNGPWNQPNTLKAHFQDYVAAEEQRILEGLETVRYDIDAEDTLGLVLGPGRVEKSLLPLLSLLLKRHLELFRLCRRTVLNMQELVDARETIRTWVTLVAGQRFVELEAAFEQQGLDSSQRFKTFACGLFANCTDIDKFESVEHQLKLEFHDLACPEGDEEQYMTAAPLPLKYPHPTHGLYEVPEDVSTTYDDTVDAAVRSILGRWHGFIYKEGLPLGPMLSFSFHASADHATYEASAVTDSASRFTIFGGYTHGRAGAIEYTFSITHLPQTPTFYCLGTIDADGRKLSGRCGPDKDDMPHTFQFFKSIPPEVIIARPPPLEFEASRVRALWKYALTAALNQARRKMFSWSYLRERRALRQEYQELLEHDVTMLPSDTRRRRWLDMLITYEDMRALHVLHTLRQPQILERVFYCDVCQERMHGSHLICLTCRGPGHTVDICDKTACKEAVAFRDDLARPHQPFHDYLKVRRGIYYHREIGKLFRMSDAGLERARKLLTPVPTTKAAATSPEHQHAGQVNDEEDASVLASTPTCISCSSAVSYPCWYCIDCPADAKAFICAECDENKGGLTIGEHLETHSLVSCKLQVAEETDPSKRVEKRLSALEGKMETLAQGDKSTEERLSALEGKLAGLTEQMTRMEQLLQSLAVSRGA